MINQRLYLVKGEEVKPLNFESPPHDYKYYRPPLRNTPSPYNISLRQDAAENRAALLRCCCRVISWKEFLRIVRNLFANLVQNSRNVIGQIIGKFFMDHDGPAAEIDDSCRLIDSRELCHDQVAPAGNHTSRAFAAPAPNRTKKSCRVRRPHRPRNPCLRRSPYRVPLK